MIDVQQLLDEAAEHLAAGITVGEPAGAALTRTLRAQHAVLRAQIAALRQPAQAGPPPTKAAPPAPMTVSINGGQPLACSVRFEQDMIDVSSLTASKPDPAWQMVDAAGHYHAWAKGGQLPTLTIVEVPEPCEECDDDEDDEPCEGHTRTEYQCRLCHQVIEPRTVPDEAARNRRIPGRSNHIILIDGLTDQPPPETTGLVSVKVTAGAKTMFGPGYATRLSAIPQGDLTHLVLRIDAGLVERLAA
jgi:hypothetical protein